MKKMSSKLLLSTLALAVSSAYADDMQAANEAASDAGREGVQRVVVTAQKRVQTTIDVAQSMTVISGLGLEKEQAASFSDYLKLVPGLQLVQGTQGAGRLVLRGINTGGVASTVAVYIDETPFGSSSGLVNGGVLAADFDTFDMARIEVLRGPQGALYGASSLGGLLKFVTNAPNKKKSSMRMRAGVANVDGDGMAYKTNLMVNAPISDTLAFRASGSYNREPGFIDSIGTAGSDVQNDINKSHSGSARASLLYTPNSALSVRLTAVAQDINTTAPSSVESDPNTLETLYGRQSQSQYVPQFRNVKYRVVNATADYDFGVATLTSSSSWAKQDQTIRDDASFNLSALVKDAFGSANDLYMAQNTNLKKFTQELRLVSNKSESLDWLVGAYFTKEDGLIRQAYVPVTPNTLDLITSLPNLALVTLNSSYKELAGFGNVTAHFGPQVDVDLGARYSKNTQDAVQFGVGALVGPASTTYANSSEKVSTYSVAPKYKLSENAAVYARLAKGYRPGGPNIIPPNAPAGTPSTFDSDTVLSYELGLKSYTSDGLFGIEAALFHIKWQDIQLLAVVNGFGVNTNGVSATSDGLEFTLRARPMPGLNVSLNGAYNNARLDGSTSPLVGGNAGDKLPFSPKLTVGLNGDYRWPLATGTAYAGASLRHLSSQSGAFDATYRSANGKQRELPSYGVFDMHAGLERGSWTFDSYVKNLNNSDGKTSTSAIKANGSNLYPNGAIRTGMISPRTIGFAVTKEY